MYLDAQNTFSKVSHKISFTTVLHVFIPMVNNKAKDNEWKMVSV